MSKDIQKKNKKYNKANNRSGSKLLPLFICSIILIVLGVGVPRILAHFPALTEKYFTGRVYVRIRAVVGYLPNLTKLSITEIVAWTLVIVVLVIIIVSLICIFMGKFKLKRLFHRLCALLFAVGILLNLFNITDGLNYYNAKLEEKFDLEVKPRTDTQLYGLCIWLRRDANSLRGEVDTNSDGIFIIKDIDRALADVATAVRSIKEINPKNNRVPVAKQVYSSDVMTAFGIEGIYMPFFAEANVNVAQPSLTIPSSAAHENAHYLGVAREDEANFISYLACISSDDVNIRYSGVMMALMYASGRLYEADKSLYNELINGYDDGVMADMKNYSEYWKSDGSFTRTLSSKVNDTYLKFNGSSEGEKSYGGMVDLLLAYYDAANSY